MASANAGPIPMRTRTDEVVQRIRAAISQGTLQPGQRLVETELASQFSVSRVPVREAIQKLTEEGLVRRIPRFGAFVSIPSLREIEEISSLRIVLEEFVVERVIERWKPQHEERLRQIVRAMQAAAALPDIQQMYAQDLLFHQTLWILADHAILLETASNLRSRINHFLFEAARILPAEELSRHTGGHHEIIELIAAGDVAQAKASMRGHITVATSRILSYYQRTFTATDGFVPNGVSS